MRIVHITATDSLGGAATVVWNLHRCLRNAGFDSHMLVNRKNRDDPYIHGLNSNTGRLWLELAPMLDQWPLRRYSKRPARDFSPGWISGQTLKRLDALAPDLVHLHWINAGMLKVRDIARIPYPVMWTLHDQWAWTGGCHVALGCQKWLTGCGACPALSSSKKNDLSAKTWASKRKIFTRKKLHIACVSRAMCELAERSPLLGRQSLRVIHNGVDTHIFKPQHKIAARAFLNLPAHVPLIAFGAISALHDSNKGFDLLQPALKALAAIIPQAEAIIFGAGQPASPPDLGIPVHYQGYISDKVTMSLIYNAADVTVVPSREEALSFAAIESQSCGTPVVGFDTTGLKDAVAHGSSGYLARCYDPQDLATGILWCLDPQRHPTLQRQARQHVEQFFSLDQQLQAYIDYYSEALGTNLQPVQIQQSQQTIVPTGKRSALSRLPSRKNYENSHSALRICLDARLQHGCHGGIQQTIMGLAYGLSQLKDGNERYFFLVNPGDADWLKPFMGSNCQLLFTHLHDSLAPRPPSQRLSAALRRRMSYKGPVLPVSEGLIEATGIDLMHFTTQRLFRTSIPFVYCPHDLQHRHLPHLFTPQEVRNREFTYAYGCRRAAAVLAMTRWGAGGICHAYKINPQRVAVIPWASMLSLYPPADPSSGKGLPSRFFFYPAQTWRHKQHWVIIRALAHLRDHHGLEVPVVFSGKETADAPDLYRLAKDLQVRHLIINEGFIDEARLQHCYAQCCALIYPSAFEGFGMPLIEAMDYRKPIIASNLPVLQEVCEGYAHFVTVGDVSSLAQAMIRCWQGQMQATATPPSFSWQQSALQLRAWYRSLTHQPLNEEDRILLRKSAYAATQEEMSFC